MRVSLQIALLALVGLVATGCPGNRSQKTEAVPLASAGGAPTAAESADARQTIRELRTQNQQQVVALLARRAESEQLREQLRRQQALLEEAIQEVVRARAKQRSLQSRAQAATEIAEAEIALERLAASEHGSAEAGQAGRLLEGASAEYEAENFGGALYLASQAKGRIRLAATGRVTSGVDGGVARVEGEQPFGFPVPLAVVERSNFREGPGTEFPVLETFDPGTSLTGHASMGAWIRVTGEGDRAGWIHSSLVDGG